MSTLDMDDRESFGSGTSEPRNCRGTACKIRNYLSVWTYSCGVVARKPQPMDRAAWAYIKAQSDAQKMERAELARRAGIPYQTVRGWWDAENPPALSLADVGRFLRALGVDGGEAYEAIERLALTLEEPAE